jgi:hypothetical protein
LTLILILFLRIPRKTALKARSNPRIKSQSRFPLLTKFQSDHDATNPWVAQIRLITLADEVDTIRQFDLQRQELPPEILGALPRSGWIAHNAKFEMMFLARRYGIVPKAVFCTQTASRLLTNGMPKTVEPPPPHEENQERDN